MTTVLKDPTGRHARSRFKPDHTIGQLVELRQIIDHYNGGGGD